MIRWASAESGSRKVTALQKVEVQANVNVKEKPAEPQFLNASLNPNLNLL